MDFLDKLRAKPSDVRAQYAFFVASFITGIIAIIWVSTLPAQVAKVMKVNEGEITDSAESVDPKTFSDLIEDSGGKVGTVIEAVQDLNNLPAEMDMITQNLNGLEVGTTEDFLKETQETARLQVVEKIINEEIKPIDPEPVTKNIMIEVRKGASPVVLIGIASTTE